MPGKPYHGDVCVNECPNYGIMLSVFSWPGHSQTRHTSLTAAAVNRLWRATRVPQNYRPGFIVAQGP